MNCGKDLEFFDSVIQQHPTVFTYGGRGFDNRSGHASNRPVQFFKSLHFNFRYTQYPGVDFTYAQFLYATVLTVYFQMFYFFEFL